MAPMEDQTMSTEILVSTLMQKMIDSVQKVLSKKDILHPTTETIRNIRVPILIEIGVRVLTMIVLGVKVPMKIEIGPTATTTIVMGILPPIKIGIGAKAPIGAIIGVTFGVKVPIIGVFKEIGAQARTINKMGTEKIGLICTNAMNARQ